jgi:hypothetical protein
MINNKILKDAVEHAVKDIDNIDVQSLIDLKMKSSDNGYDINISSNIIGFPFTLCKVNIFSLGGNQSGISIKPKDLEPLNTLVEDDITLGVILRFLKRAVVSVLYSLECGYISDGFSPMNSTKTELYKRIEKEVEVELRNQKINQFL